MKPHLRLPLSIAAFCGLVILGFTLFDSEGASKIAQPEIAGPSEAARGDVTLSPTPEEDVRRAQQQDEKAATSDPSSSSVAPAEQLDPIVIRGRVVDGDDLPIPNASLLLAGRHYSSNPTLLAEGDPAGQLLAHFELGDIAPNLVQRLIVVAPGFARQTQTFVPVPGNAVDLGKVVLQPGSEITGTVFDPGGVPMPGVFVSAGRTDSSHYGRDRTWVNGTTDSNGVFALQGVGPGRRIVHANRGPLKTSSLPFTLEAGTPVHIDLSLKLQEGHTTFQVLGPDGAPHAASKIELLADQPFETHRFQTARFDTEEDGTATWSTKVHSLARALDTSGRYATTSRLPFQPGTHVVLRFVQRPELKVRLRTPPGAPVAWGHVRLSEHEAMIPGGADGRLELPLPEESFMLEAFAPGFRRGLFGPYTPGEVREPITLWLERGDSLRGVVLHRGKPVASARVSLTLLPEKPRTTVLGASFDFPFHYEATIHRGQHDATTNEAGEFIASLPTEGRYAVTVEADDFPLQTLGPWTWTPDAEPTIELSLARSGTLEGRVLGGRPIDRESTLVAVSNGWGYVFTTPIRADGTYRFEGLAPGPWQVRPTPAPAARIQAVSGEYRWAEEERVSWDVTVQPSATAIFDLDLDPYYRSVLEGRLEQTGPHGAKVHLRNEAGWLATGVLDADGRFVLRSSHVGSATLIVEGRFLVTAEIELRVGVQRWTERIEIGELVIAPTEPQGQYTQVDIVTQLPGGSQVEQSTGLPSGSGDPLPIEVPVGLTRISIRTYNPRETRFLGEVHIDAGETVDFPLD